MKPTPTKTQNNTQTQATIGQDQNDPPNEKSSQVEWGVQRAQNTMNYHFQNINGLKWSRENLPLMIEGIKNAAMYQLNIIALVETNTEW